MGIEYDAAGEYLIMNGVKCGDSVPASKVQLLLANFHSENLDVVGFNFKHWWKANVTHTKSPLTGQEVP